MYDELMKRLREDKSWVEQGLSDTEHEISEHIQQAADAIAELIKKLNHADEQIEKLVEAAEERCWIPVTERLPEYGQKCLVAFKLISHNDFSIQVSYCYVQKEGFWSDCGRNYKAVAWQPLPEPPKEE